MKNRRWLIAANPLGRALQASDFRADEGVAPAPGAGEFLVRVSMLSFDPALKSYMENIAGYASPTQIGDVMPGEGAGAVVQSNHPGFPVGARVKGLFGWQDYAMSNGAGTALIPDGVSDEAALGVLGTTGKTAYCGLVEAGKPKPGDVLVVSGAAGATGSIVGQIGKIAGCTVIGIAGGPEKCKRLIEAFGFDAAIDYKNEKVRSRLRALAPGGVDVFFDNVGGEILNDVLARLAHGARVVVCGAIARYNFDPRDAAQMPEGPRNYFNVVHAHATIQGFILHHYERFHATAETRLAGWLKSGRLTAAADVLDGLERAPEALIRLFEGRNFGKQLVRIAG